MAKESVQDTKHLKLHETDVISTLDKLKSYQSPHFDVTYFLNLAMDYSFSRQKFKGKPKISIMGLTMPEEFIYAVGAQPMWMLGGSFSSALYTDKFVPRDTDSVTKAALGFVRSDIYPAYDDSDLLIIPITSDSMRKVALMLSKEVEVFPLDVPPVKGDPTAKKKWMTQINALIGILEKKTKTPLTKKNLLNASNTVNAAKVEMQKLLHYCMSAPDLIPEALVLFILNTYYFTQDIAEWILKLRALNTKLKLKTSPRHDSHSYNNEKPRILIAGSPIYFPNFKLPLLYSGLDVNIAAFATEMTRRVYSETEIPETRTSLGKLVENIAYTHYLEDSSPAFVDNSSRSEYVESLYKNVHIDGVIYHVLKGQIDYDFDLPYFENFFGAKNIPVFRLETDYNHQDIEQLRVRSEAFVEMISVKYKKSYVSDYEKLRA